MALVIRTWRCSERADAQGNFIYIEGRQAGIIAWFLTVIGIDVTTKLRINENCIYFEQGSLEGFFQRVIPLTRMSSGFFGYKKPWKEALALAIFCGVLFGSIAGAVMSVSRASEAASIFTSGLFTFGVGAVVGFLYYYLNKTTTIGVVEVGGIISSIEFMRSVLEGQNIDETEGHRLIGIIRQLIERNAR